MSDLISRSALLKEIRERAGMWKRTAEVFCEVIEGQPTVEAVSVVHAEWRHIGGDEWCCSECGNVISTEGSWEKPTGKFCEECGADMRTSAE